MDAEPIFSPDGRWLAYRSSESGRIEIFVEGFDGVRGKWQVSNGGGRDAAWSTVRRELLYFGTTQDRIMVALYEVMGESFRVAAPRPWSIIRVGRPPRTGRTFDLHPDGERVVAAPAENQKSDHMIFVSDLAARTAPACARGAVGRLEEKPEPEPHQPLAASSDAGDLVRRWRCRARRPGC